MDFVVLFKQTFFFSRFLFECGGEVLKFLFDLFHFEILISNHTFKDRKFIQNFFDKRRRGLISCRYSLFEKLLFYPVRQSNCETTPCN